MKITRYHEDLTNLHINTLEPRAYFIPYASLENALSFAHFFSNCEFFSVKTTRVFIWYKWWVNLEWIVKV